MTNTNCLEGMQCPKCHSFEPFAIAVKTIMKVSDDGCEDDYGQTDWDDDSFCECLECDFSGTVADFNANKALFQLGQVGSTPGALASCSTGYLEECLYRHMHGDWGNVCEEDAATNTEAVKKGFRILSAYPIDPGKPCKGFGENTLWIITEADRSATTFLLPEEY